MAESLGNKAAKGAVWATVDKVGSLALQFGVNLVLARLLMPSDYGVIGMLTIFIAVSQVLIDAGFGSALIQKKEPTQRDFSTIFIWNVLFSLLLYLVLFLIAPYVAEYFSMPVLCNVLRLIGITLIINSVLSIQTTKLRKELSFKAIALTNLSSYIIGAIVAIIAAYNDAGVWSLVSMQLTYGGMSVTIMWIITRWHPSLCFSIQTMQELFGFGGYLMAANILQEICRNIQGIIIGKKYSVAQLGYYSQAHKFDSVTSNALPQVISQVMFPVFSKLQNDLQMMAKHLDKCVRIIAFITLPIIGGLILFAEPTIEFLYGDKWLPCVPYYQVFCIGGIVVSFININFYVVAALGKSKVLFYWSFYKWGVLLIAILIGMNFGVIGIVWGVVISNFNTYLVNATLACRYLSISILSQIYRWLYILIFVAISMAISKCLYTFIDIHVIANIAAYVITYLSLNLIFNKKDFICIISAAKQLKQSPANH